MLGYDRRSVEAMRQKNEAEAKLPNWLFRLILAIFALYAIVLYA